MLESLIFDASTPAGCYAEYVSTKEAYLAHQPATLSYEEAGGVPLAALTAYQVRQTSNPMEHDSAQNFADQMLS